MTSISVNKRLWSINEKDTLQNDVCRTLNKYSRSCKSADILKAPERMTKSTSSRRRLSKSQPQTCQARYKIDIRPLKAFVSEKFPRNWPLREALLAERDVLDAEEFLAKMETWLNLLRMM